MPCKRQLRFGGYRNLHDAIDLRACILGRGLAAASVVAPFDILSIEKNEPKNCMTYDIMYFQIVFFQGSTESDLNRIPPTSPRALRFQVM